MSTKETVRVTADHIARGEPQDPSACPIALAIRELHPHATHADVYSDFAWLEDDVFVTASLPDVARQFVEGFDFDTELYAEPVEFELTWQTAREIEADQ